MHIIEQVISNQTKVFAGYGQTTGKPLLFTWGQVTPVTIFADATSAENELEKLKEVWEIEGLSVRRL